MQRFATLIVLIFAFGALVGVSTAHAHRYHSTPIVVLNLVDADNKSIPVVVKVQRGNIDLGSGITMPCGHHHAVPVSTPSLPQPPSGARPLGFVYSSLPGCPGPLPVRPPIKA